MYKVKMDNEKYLNIITGNIQDEFVPGKTIGPLSFHMCIEARERIFRVHRAFAAKKLNLADLDSVAELVDALSSLLIVMPDREVKNGEK